jgi:hypothetical protein
MRKQIIAVLGILVLLVTAMAVGAFVTRADAADGYSQDPDAPTLVDEVQQGFRPVGRPQVTEDNCVQTLRQVYSRYTPGQDETTHQEWGSEERTREWVPPVSHTEYRFPFEVREYVPAVEGVKEFKYKQKVVDHKTQYHFRKFTRTKESHNYGITWSDYGPWTPWEPETHTSWEDGNAPLGTPAFHGEDNSGRDRWYRQWQAQWDGQTREVESGSHHEYTDWTTDLLGAPWVKIDERWKVEPQPGHWGPWTPGGITDWSTDPIKPADTDTVRYGDVESQEVEDEAGHYTDWSPWTVLDTGLLAEPVLPENTLTHEYRVTGPFEVGNEDSTEGFSEFVYTAMTDGEPCERPTGHRDRDVSEKCVNGDVMRTTTVSGASPVQAEDGSWFLAPYAHSEQRVVGEDDCAPVVFRKPPEKQQVLPNTGASDHLGLLAALSAALVVSGGVAMAASRRRA